MSFVVLMKLGAPPLVEAREVSATREPVSLEEADRLEAQLRECVGVGGIGRESLTLLDVSIRLSDEWLAEQRRRVAAR